MDKKDHVFLDSCKSFKDYKSISEYIKDIQKCLMLSSWHYSEQKANERINENLSFIEASYKNKESAWNAAVDAGFCCG